MPSKSRNTANLVSDNNLFVNTTTDNTGIGTANPTSKLHVVGNVLVSGIVTASSFVGNLTGTATTATNLSDAANITTGTISSARLSGTYDINVSYANTSGISTVAQGLTGTPNITVGIVTASSFVGPLTGTATTATNVSGGIGSITQLSVSGISTLGITSTTNLTTQNLSVSGISTLGTVQVSSGIITATSGIVTYYGDGYNLLRTKQSYQLNGTTVGTATTLNIVGAGSSSVLLNDVLSLTISNTVRTVNTYTATLNQTTFSATYNFGFVDVYFNGSKLSSDQYTATDGLNIVLETGASLGDIVDIIGYTTYRVVGTQTILSDTYSSTSGITTSYTGVADQGSSQSADVWSIRRSIFTSAGILSTTANASNVAWINRLSVTYT